MHAERYRSSLATAMGLPADRFDEPGVDVVTGADRHGRRLVTHYRVGGRSVVWTDPDLVDVLAEWNGRPMAVTFDEFRSWAREQGAEPLGAGYEHVLTGPYDPPSRPDAVEVLDGGDASVVASARELLEGCPDRDDAEFELAALDEHLAAWIADGQFDALAGGRRFDPRPGFHDVGVLVHPAQRRRGLGRHVVAAVVESILAADHAPLYRCSADHEGSWRLARRLGFTEVAELEAFVWPA
jgi:GNAT superfamily N-acetyltransferase